MTNKTRRDFLKLAGATAAGLATGQAFADTENPFGFKKLDGGYQQQAAMSEGKCGEGKCGEGKCGNKPTEGKCGEGKCGEGKCGNKPKPTEGKCGEGKCGGRS